jgi:hypothetical protein
VNWLAPVEAALAEAPRPVTFFFRDDDVGWRDDRLRRLLGIFDRFSTPIDLAVIPSALVESLARELRARREAAPVSTGLHQHGFAHANHEPAGRKCEFGDARDERTQREDIEAGRLRLEGLLEAPLDPIFTPPWNRCTIATGRALVSAGHRVLSRESRAPALEVRGLAELPIHIDWFAQRKGVRLMRPELAVAIAEQARRGGPVGIMLHHAMMDGAERDGVSELLAVLAKCARLTRMIDLVNGTAA